MRALVTGAAGFVGTHLVRDLRARGVDVVAVDRLSGRGITPVELTDRAAVATLVARTSPSHVFHLGGLLRAPDYASLYEVNVIATAHLLEALSGLAMKPRVLVASSSAVYGTGPADAPMVESRPAAPLNHYGASKVAQEAVVLQAVGTHRLPALISRTFNIVGPGQPATLAAGSFAEQLARAERLPSPHLETGDLSAIRDFVDVRDVVAAMRALMEHGEPGQAYNVCTGVPRTISLCVDGLIAACRVKVSVAQAASRSHTHALEAQVGDPGRLKALTGWRPEVSFEQSMNDLLDSWRQKVSVEGHS
jgi:GDP-4-dehydro-6-deoxy-D-mannose reductase